MDSQASKGGASGNETVIIRQGLNHW